MSIINYSIKSKHSFLPIGKFNIKVNNISVIIQSCNNPLFSPFTKGDCWTSIFIFWCLNCRQYFNIEVKQSHPGRGRTKEEGNGIKSYNISRIIQIYPLFPPFIQDAVVLQYLFNGE